MEASGKVYSSPQKSVAALRQLLERTQGNGLAGPSGLPFGVDEIDEVLPGSGLALGAAHKICEQRTDNPRASLVSLFAAAISPACPTGALVPAQPRSVRSSTCASWPYPDRVIYCEMLKDAEALPAMEEGLRHGGLAGVVGELVKLPLTPSRRLQLMAESPGVMAFALRRSGSSSDQANACFSRWRVAAAPSGPMIDFDMGRACWQLELMRCRGAEANSWTVEAPGVQSRIAVPANLGNRSPQTQEGETPKKQPQPPVQIALGQRP